MALAVHCKNAVLDFLRVLRHRFGSLPIILMSGVPITDAGRGFSARVYLAEAFHGSRVTALGGAKIVPSTRVVIPADGMLGLGRRGDGLNDAAV